MVFENKRFFESFPINFQEKNGLQNNNIFAISRVLDFIGWLDSLEDQDNVSILSATKRLYLHRLFDALDYTIAAEKAILIAICDAIAFDYNIKAYEYASIDYGYTAAQVTQIKMNLIKEFWEINSYIGTKYAIRRTLEIFLFSEITITDNITPLARRDGRWLRNGRLLRDGTVINSWAFHDVDAVKPILMTVDQAKVVAAAICEGYQPIYTTVYDLNIT